MNSCKALVTILSALCAAATPAAAAVPVGATGPQPAKRADVVPAAASAEPFIAALSASFSTWDADGDGVLAIPELDAALADPAITGDAAAALAAVKRLSRGKSTSTIPRTLESLQQTARTPGQPNAKDSENGDRDAPDLPGKFADGRRRIAAAHRELFANGAPRLECLHQGKMGNCFSLAPLGSMLHRDPAQVMAMIRPAAAGAYEVRLGQRAVIVPGPTDAEIALSSSTEATGLWANVYEKAAGVARNELRAEKDRYTTPLDAIARGGSAGTMLAFITGHEMVRFTLTWAKDPKTPPDEFQSRLAELRTKLATAFAERRCVTTGTTRPTLPGLRGGHAYGVIGYDAETDHIRTWDPHGDAFTPKGEPGPDTGFPRQDGICTMPLAVFVKHFAGLAFELLPETPSTASATSAGSSAVD